MEKEESLEKKMDTQEEGTRINKKIRRGEYSRRLEGKSWKDEKNKMEKMKWGKKEGHTKE